MPKTNEEIYRNADEAYRFLMQGSYFTFSMCGLDIARNFLQSPVSSVNSDPYGRKSCLVFDDYQDLFDFCAEILEDVECDQCGIFIIRTNGNAFSIIKSFDEDGLESVITVYELDLPLGVTNFGAIGIMAINENLYLYGLIVEVGEGKFEVIEK